MDFAEILFGTVVFMLSYIYFRWSQLRNFWLEQSVPHKPFHPIFGSLTFLQKINPGIWMRQMYDEFRTPYIGIWLFWRPAIVINSPKIARNILTKDSSVFRDRFLTCANSDHLGKLNLFTSKDPEWGNARRRLTTAFSTAKLRAMDSFFLSKTKELLQRIEQDKIFQIDIKEMYTDFTTDIIGTSAFGVKCNSTLTGQDPIRNITKEFGSFDTLRGLSWCSIFFLPDVANLFRCKFFPTSSTNYFRKIIRKVVAERESSNYAGDCNDLLGALLKFGREEKKLENTDPEFIENFIVAQAAIFLNAGYDTIGNVLSYTTFELAHYPEIQEKLYRELLDVKEKFGSENFNSNVLSEATYLNCVIKEALRKYSPMSWLDRVAVADYKVDDHVTIKAGTPVYINGIGMHYDRDFFPDPDNFVPERFLPENESKIVPYSYLPFGEGPRICIGLRFGMMILRIALALVFLNYKVEKLPGTKRPTDIKIENRGMFYTPGEALKVKYISRNRTYA